MARPRARRARGAGARRGRRARPRRAGDACRWRISRRFVRGDRRWRAGCLRGRCRRQLCAALTRQWSSSIMLHFIRRSAIVLALALTVPALLAAQVTTGTVRGRVTDAASGRGIADAQILVADTRIGAVTGAGGEYVLSA